MSFPVFAIFFSGSRGISVSETLIKKNIIPEIAVTPPNSDEFKINRVARMLQLVLSTREYQLC